MKMTNKNEFIKKIIMARDKENMINKLLDYKICP